MCAYKFMLVIRIKLNCHETKKTNKQTKKMKDTKNKY